MLKFFKEPCIHCDTVNISATAACISLCFIPLKWLLYLQEKKLPTDQEEYWKRQES